MHFASKAQPTAQPNHDKLNHNHEQGKEKRLSGSRNDERSGRRKKENIKAKDTEPALSFDVIHKTVRSLHDNHRFEGRLKKIEGCRWEAILLCETWKSAKEEIWESHCGHIYMSAGGFDSKHGVGLLFNKRWKWKIQWTESVSERMIVTALKHQQRRVVLTSVHFPHTGYEEIHI